MKLIRVLQPGFQSTIQDLGRYGYAHLGISASGAADAFSLRIGNLLVGNPENTPAVEMTLVGGEFEFERPSVFSIAGSDFGPTLDGQTIPVWKALKAPAGGRLQLGASKQGARCYLCVAGGIHVPSTLGSCSTHILTKLGGMNGRAFQKGDIIEVKELTERTFKMLTIHESRTSTMSQTGEVRVTKGIQADYFSDETMEKFLSNAYTVSEDSNRMGLRLAGPRLTHARDPEIITEGAPLGAVQVPPGGEPIILFVEHQTTGGYPKVANVIAADMHLVGQLRPRDKVFFREVSFDEARARLLEQEHFIQSLKELSR